MGGWAGGIVRRCSPWPVLAGNRGHWLAGNWPSPLPRHTFLPVNISGCAAPRRAGAHPGGADGGGPGYHQAHSAGEPPATQQIQAGAWAGRGEFWPTATTFWREHGVELGEEARRGHGADAHSARCALPLSQLRCAQSPAPARPLAVPPRRSLWRATASPSSLGWPLASTPTPSLASSSPPTRCLASSPRSATPTRAC